jgi:hypothetical protein
MLELNACVGCGELPVGLGVVGISIFLPSCDFVDESLLVWDAASEALGGENAAFINKRQLYLVRSIVSCDSARLLLS